MKEIYRRLLWETDGQDLIEYALLAGTIAIGVVVAMRTVRGALRNTFNSVATTLGS